jgi:hypothetical protein
MDAKKSRDVRVGWRIQRRDIGGMIGKKKGGREGGRKEVRGQIACWSLTAYWIEELAL